MYDTISLKSPYVSDFVVEKVLSFCNKYNGVCMSTGEVIYEFTRGELQGSYDYRIRLDVRNYDYKYNYVTGIPEKVDTSYYIIVECSIHKLLIGHNVYGGPDSIKECIKYLVKFIEYNVGVNLPEWDNWYIMRLDIAFVYKFKDDKEIKEYLMIMKEMYYMRRRVMFTGTGFYIPGSVTTVKGYMKSIEFLKHDYKRIKRYCLCWLDKNYRQRDEPIIRCMLNKIELIKEESKGIFRVEVEIKKRKLEELFECKVEKLDDKKLKEIYLKEIEKIYWEGDNIIVKSIDVMKRLIMEYGDGLGRILYGTWTMLNMYGEDYVKEVVNKETLRRHKRLLKNVGCIWNVKIMQENNVLIFKPGLNNVYDKKDEGLEEKLKMII